MPTIAKVNSAHNIRMSIRYARDSKDEQGRYKLHDKIGINCNPDDAEVDFEATNFANQWSSRSHVQLKKFVLGFGPLTKDTLSAQEAHIYAERLLSKYNSELGGGWRIAAYAHKDRPNSYHYHVLIDNCNIKNGQKLTTVYKDVEKLRSLNDEVSRSFGIKPVQKTRLVAKDMPEIKSQEKAQKSDEPKYAYQDHVRVLMSKAMLKANNFNEFKQVLHHNHADLKANFTNQKSKTGTIILPSIQPNGDYNHDKNGNRTKRKVRTEKLGLVFDKSNILEQLSKPINQRDSKYMSVYQKYNKTPNSVILKHTNTTPFVNNDDKEEKTSSEYLNSPVVRNRFKTKGEINLEQQFNLIRTIQKLNKRFAEAKPALKQSSRRKGRSVARASSTNQQARQHLNSIQKSRRRFAESNSRFTKSIINQPQFQFSASRREQESGPGQSEVKRQKQSINQSNSIIQRYKAAIRQFRKRNWRKVVKQAQKLRSKFNSGRQNFENISNKFANILSNFRDSNQYLSARKKGQFVKSKEILKSMEKPKKLFLPKLFKDFNDNWLNHNQLLHKYHDEHYNYIQHRRGYSYARFNEHGETNLQTFYKNLSPKSQIYMLSLMSLGDSDIDKPNSDFIKLSKFYLNQKKVHSNTIYNGISSMPLSNQSHILLRTVQDNSRQLNIHDSSLVDDVVFNIYFDNYNLGSSRHYSDVISKGSTSSKLSKYNNKYEVHLQYNYSNNSNSKQEPVKKSTQSINTSSPHTNQINNINRQRKSIKDNKRRTIGHHGPHMHI